eukprot:17239_6
MTIQEIKESLEGPLGSRTVLAFRRPASKKSKEEQYYAVELQRNYIESMTGFTQPRTLRYVYLDETRFDCTLQLDVFHSKKTLEIL